MFPFLVALRENGFFRDLNSSGGKERAKRLVREDFPV